jgi:ABC-type transporter Mla subunit MlaD
MSLTVVKVDKHGPLVRVSEVVKYVEGMVNSENYFLGRAQIVSKDVDVAVKKMETMTSEFAKALSKFAAMEAEVVEKAKKTSGSVRDSADKLAAGLTKLEKAADFNRLERYVDLLERAATALTTLAELERAGKLDKISSALK